MAEMGAVSYRLHALQRMLERGITRADVQAVLGGNEVIETAYRPGRPLPTRLLLGWVAGRPVHVLVADHPAGQHYVSTVYEPDPNHWEPDCRTRKDPR